MFSFMVTVGDISQIEVWTKYERVKMVITGMLKFWARHRRNRRRIDDERSDVRLLYTNYATYLIIRMHNLVSFPKIILIQYPG